MPIPKDKNSLGKGCETDLHFRIPSETHEQLRRISFDTRKSISQICREGIEVIIKDYKKNIRT